MQVLTGDTQADIPAPTVAAAKAVSAADGRFLRETGLAASVVALVAPPLDDMGFRLVRTATWRAY